MNRVFHALPLTLAFLAPALARAADAPLASRVSVQVSADTSAITPGKPFTVAVTLTTFFDWHIYWSNPGESGIATSFLWKLPAGFTLQPLPMPIPSTFIQPGNITTYGYTGKTTFLFQVTPPGNLSGNLSFSTTINWLCCNKDQCVPGTAAPALTLPAATAADPAKPANADLFNAARAELPADQPPPELFVMAVPYADDGDEQYALQIGWAKLPATVEIYPPDLDGLNLTLTSAATSAGQPRQGRLMAVNRTLAGDTLAKLKAHVLAGQKVTADKIPLLIVYTLPGDSVRHAFTLPLNPADLGIK